MATHKLLKCVQKRRYQPVGYFVAIGDRQSLFQFRLYLLDNLRQVSSLTSAFFSWEYASTLSFPD